MDFKPLEGREFPRFSGIKTFFRLPIAEPDAKFDVALFGIPFDGGASYRTGQRFAPTHIREASSLGRGYHWNRDLVYFKKLKVADVGDCPTVPIDLKQTYDRIEKFVYGLVKDGKKFIASGGDHSVTLPILRALNKHYKKPIGLIHFDAHYDTYPPAWDCDFHHGTFARHAVTEKLIDPKKTVQIGIRGPFAVKEDSDFASKHGFKVWTIDEIRKRGVDALVKEWPDFGDTPVYLSFDVDAMDPSCAPGTGTPVIGGLNSYEAQQFLRNLPKVNLVGGDVVEVIPQFDPAQITQLLAVDVMFEILSHMAAQV
ncbi:MAG: agmatinase [Oligoflexia bacterium]|nr:agmatinase [Oligoflexia bacterium]